MYLGFHIAAKEIRHVNVEQCLSVQKPQLSQSQIPYIQV